MKRKIIRRSIVKHMFTLAQPSWPDASRVSQPASASAPQPARTSPLRQAWLAVLPRGLGATRPLNHYLATACVALATCAAISAHAQYSNPPTWSPMTMLTVSFDTATLRLDVVDQATKMGAGVYPVLALAPLGTYDPAQPWGVLNGTKYSRRLGWDDVNKNQTDGTAILDKIHTTYGAAATLWIESIAQDPALKCYLAIGRYGVNADNTMTVDPTINAYSGIFGTAGSPTKWRWDGKMDHNTYAVSLSDITTPWQLFSATYKVYVGDALGNEILNPDLSSASTIETWTWQAVPEPASLSLAVMGISGLLASRRIKA